MRNTRRILPACIMLLLFVAISVFPAEAGRKVKSPTLSKTSVKLDAGKSVRLKVKKAEGKKVTWKSSNKKIATVSKKGLVKAKKAGKCTVTAKVGKKALRCRVTVRKGKTGGTADVNKPLFIIGKTTLTTGDTHPYSYGPDDMFLDGARWSSSDPDVLSISGTGAATAKKQGTVTITLEGKAGGKTYSASLKVTVKPSEKEAEENQTRAELAAAKAKGPEAFIDYCETHRSTVNIGDYYGNRLPAQGRRPGVDATADYKWAIDSLFFPWLKRMEAACKADKTDNKQIKMSLFVSLVNVLYSSKKITYGPHIKYWCFCPAIARVLHDDEIAAKQAEGNIIFGTCVGFSDLIVAYAKTLGVEAEYYNTLPSNPSHVGVLATIDGHKYVFDAQTGLQAELVNGQQVFPPNDEVVAIFQAYGYPDVSAVPE